MLYTVKSGLICSDTIKLGGFQRQLVKRGYYSFKMRGLNASLHFTVIEAILQGAAPKSLQLYYCLY